MCVKLASNKVATDYWDGYKDGIFRDNVLFSQDKMVALSSTINDANDIYGRLNRNSLVLGTAGSGKTSSFVLPNLLQLNSSYVVTSTGLSAEESLYDLLATFFEANGYKVIHFDFRLGPAVPIEFFYKNFGTLAREKTIIFCTFSAYAEYHQIQSIPFILKKIAEDLRNVPYPPPIGTQFILDDFQMIPKIPDLFPLMKSLEGWKVSFNIILQNYLVTERIYKRDWKKIIKLLDFILCMDDNSLRNSGYQIPLPPLPELYGIENDDCILYREKSKQEPVITKKFKLKNHPNYNYCPNLKRA